MVQRAFLYVEIILTGLYNRNYYEKALMILDKEEFHPISVIACDLDELKKVNDSWGHHAGDMLLKECANLLKKSVRNSDILARIGGDEFFIIMTKTDEQMVAKVIERIYHNINVYNDSHRLPIRISIGFSTGIDKSKSLSEILKEADRRMYAVKRMKEMQGI